MKTIFIALLIALGGTIVSLFFEAGRDFWADVWERMIEIFQYIISFEWVGDFFSFVGGMFENLGEFSFIGLVFGLITAVIVFLLRKWMLNPFLQYMSPVSKIIWAVATYVVCFIVGYLIGKRMFDD